jgi:hypothetical protein
MNLLRSGATGAQSTLDRRSENKLLLRLGHRSARLGRLFLVHVHSLRGSKIKSRVPIHRCQCLSHAFIDAKDRLGLRQLNVTR